MTRVDEDGKGGGDMNTVWREGEETAILLVCYFCTAKQSDSDDRYCNTVTTRRTAAVTGTRPSGASRQASQSVVG